MRLYITHGIFIKYGVMYYTLHSLQLVQAPTGNDQEHRLHHADGSWRFRREHRVQ